MERLTGEINVLVDGATERCVHDILRKSAFQPCNRIAFVESSESGIVFS